uniref:Uncharacterized protein n=1 Tax=Arundo donax TaxID=35708 RepID=A0A0A8ZV11_ARUDO
MQRQANLTLLPNALSPGQTKPVRTSDTRVQRRDTLLHSSKKT